MNVRCRGRSLVPLVACCCLVLAPGRFGAQQSETLPIHKRRISDRVLVVWPGDFAQTTTMIAIASEQGIVVVDTETSWSLTAEIKEVIEREFERDDFNYLINTHGHGDHGGGNQVFKDALIIAHDRCPELLRARLDERNLEYARQGRQIRLARLEGLLASLPPNHPDTASIEEQIRYLRRILGDLESGFELTLPEVTFSDRLTLFLGDVTVQLYYFGGLHTDDHIVVHVPEEALLLTGDILTDSWLPVLSQSDDVDIPMMLAHWETILRQEAELRHVVNGHRDLDLSLAYFRQAHQYVHTLWEEVQVVRSEGLDLDTTCERLSLHSRFPTFRDVVFVSDGTDYHCANIERIWSLLDRSER